MKKQTVLSLYIKVRCKLYDSFFLFIIFSFSELSHLH